MINWKVHKDTISLIKLEHFDPVHTFECGQCFRWQQSDNGNWIGVAKNRALEVEWTGQDLVFYNTSERDFFNIWYTYFDLGRDYGQIKKRLSKNDTIMQEAISFGGGIRLLKQDFEETLISFLISQNNGIPRIRKIVEALSRKFGEHIIASKQEAYSFPTCEKLSGITLEELGSIRAGYRDKYIYKAARQMCMREVDMDTIENGSLKDARSELLKLFGVGEKVADCTLLFSGMRHDIFPIDRWVKRVMAELYIGYEASNEEIAGFAEQKFGELAGFAQQYLFYYAREKKIGM